MNNFSSEIKKLEADHNDTYDIKRGKIPVILSSAHGIGQKKRNGRYKLAEPYTRAIAKYVAKKANCFYLIKNEDTGIDPNKQNDDEFKAILINLIRNNNIKLAIDLHGAKKEREFDVEIGTLDNLTISSEKTKELIKCLNQNGIKHVSLNDPFKGGDITKTVHDSAKINCLQLEINHSFRSIRNTKNMKKICRALVKFIEQIN